MMNWDYIAGLFEKGSQLGFRSDGVPIIKCSSYNYGLLKQIEEFVGYGKVTGPYKNKTIYIYSIHKRNEQLKFLETIKDKVVLKRLDIEKMLDYYVVHPVKPYITRRGRMDTIKCSGCGKYLSPSKFNNSTKNALGKQGYCKDCQREYERKRVR